MLTPWTHTRPAPRTYPAYCAQATASRRSFAPKVTSLPPLAPQPRISAASTVYPRATYH